MEKVQDENKKTIIVSAPGKLMLLGDHAVVHGFPCLVTAVNYRVFVEVSLSEQDEFIFPKNVSNTLFIEKALEMFRKEYRKNSSVRIKTWANYKESYGLGSSSAVTVALIKALSQLFSIPLSQKELFDFCYDVVLSVQGVGSGFDIAAAIWGGTLYFVTGGKKIEPLHTDRLPLIVAYSRAKGDTPALVKGVAKLYKEKQKEIRELFIQSQKLVERGREYLLRNDLKTFGELMNKNQLLLQLIKVSTPKLDNLVISAREAGAYGAKLSGAGGGDCMIAITPTDKKEAVEKALRKAGGKILSIKTNAEGVRIEKNNKKLLLFDFDGVIADSFESVAKVIIAIAEKYGLSVKNEVDVRGLFKKNLYESIKQLGLSIEMINSFLNDDLWNSVIHTTQAVKGMEKLIPYLAKQNLLVVISSAENEWVLNLLRRYSLDKYFKTILGKEAGLSKVDKIKEAMVNFSFDVLNTYYIGDTTGDIEEGRAVGVKTVGVTWGYHSSEMMEQAKPDYLVSSVEELKKVFL